jgi:FkbM family methyltransferase
MRLETMKILMRLRTILGWIKRFILQQYYSIVSPKFIQINGIKLCLGDHISETIKEVIYRGDYEGPELRIARAFLKNDDVVMEIGTGLGFLSTFCARQIGNNNVFTYEANPELKDRIQETYSINNVKPILENCLIGEHNGEHEFYLNRDFWTSSVVIQNEQDARRIKIPVKSFNQEVQRINPTFLIIDIEGGEYDLVQYANFHNVKKILIEIHHTVLGLEKANFVKMKLKESGFQINEKYSYSQEFFLER